MARIRWDLKRLSEDFAGKSVAELTVSGLVAFLEADRLSMKTYNNRRGILSTFFKFCFQRGWIAENPIPKVPHYRIRRKRGVAQSFTAEQAAAMMEYFETFEGGRWVPYFALCLFAGIRPGVPDGEITKFKPDAVNLDEEDPLELYRTLGFIEEVLLSRQYQFINLSLGPDLPIEDADA
jgi:integrase